MPGLLSANMLGYEAQVRKCWRYLAQTCGSLQICENCRRLLTEKVVRWRQGWLAVIGVMASQLLG